MSNNPKFDRYNDAITRFFETFDTPSVIEQLLDLYKYADQSNSFESIDNETTGRIRANYLHTVQHVSVLVAELGRIHQKPIVEKN